MIKTERMQKNLWNFIENIIYLLGIKMKRFFAGVSVFFVSFILFAADIVSFDDLRIKYEKLLSEQTVENLSDFSELLDVFQTGDFFISVSRKRSSYKESFYVLDQNVKDALNAFESPWVSDAETDAFSIDVSDISGPFSNFMIQQYAYVTYSSFILRTILIVLSSVFILLFVFVILYLRISRQKKLALIQTKYILQGQESERRRISGELHDTIAQNLKIQNLQLLNAKDMISEKSDVYDEWNKILESSEENMILIRDICRNLFPPDFENQKLQWILKDFCMGVENKFNVPCTFFVSKDCPADSFSSENKLHVFRIIQEAVNNAVLHSGCKSIDVSVTKKMISVKDDGLGFNVSETLSNQTGHFGLRSIIERSRILGASCEIKSDKTKGTEINIMFK